ncbi:MAG TPA: hypothetical protein VL401_01045 [Alphaproteobacteria bacterium]|jgi:hypothetical protein|nr:hypothetical protein [Alphaproteobacteria bacterium]
MNKYLKFVVWVLVLSIFTSVYLALVIFVSLFFIPDLSFMLLITPILPVLIFQFVTFVYKETSFKNRLVKVIVTMSPILVLYIFSHLFLYLGDIVSFPAMFYWFVISIAGEGICLLIEAKGKKK